ncbi:cytochrome c-type biogenesis protein [Psychrobacter sp. Ps7]|jgi:cytochrome c-type biogenesis protein CcmH|uniref:cytochrome c-type biogenesis protein n=1 Tax=Psychrobacter sp. Ps7 TaxID=2790961 RepID=UPI001EDFF1A8|nr:cytochrome c-type biogenesis protein [Psychrobacter sp. Ps7]MCG3872064.1 cytochrome c-type biogenesis protein CcmH [Psychrobacter sp. Ps7]
MNANTSLFYRLVLIPVFVLFTLLIGATNLSHAAIEVYDFDSKQQEAQYRGLIDEFRCPKCQNQNLASSDAPIAQDLKQKTYDMVKDGRSDAEIRQYMQERYGDFISYSPPVRPSTWILWFFPPLLLILILGGWFWRNHTRSKAPHKRPIMPNADINSSLTAKEQAALDRLLASREASGKTTTAKANPTETKPSNLKTSKPKSNMQTRDKGDSL